MKNKNNNDNNTNKKISPFWIFYLGMVIALFICSFAAINYLKKCINEYEASLPDKYMDYLVSTDEGKDILKSSVIAEASNLLMNSKFENTNPYVDEITNLLNTDSISYELKKNQYNANLSAYSIKIDDKDAFDISIAAINQITKLKVLVISDWEIDSIAIPHEYQSYTITAPSNLTVKLNDTELTKDEIINDVPIDILEACAELVEVPSILTYEINDLGYKPQISIIDQEGAEVSYEWSDDSTITSNDNFINLEDVNASALPIDVSRIARTWSEFYMNELAGAYGGLEKVRQYLVPDSFLDLRASEYGRRGDYYAVTKHTLNSIVNEKISNYTIYSDNCFGVDVYFKKNLIVENGRITSDEFNNRLFFVYVKDKDGVTDGWYLADVRTVLE